MVCILGKTASARFNTAAAESVVKLPGTPLRAPNGVISGRTQPVMIIRLAREPVKIG